MFQQSLTKIFLPNYCDKIPLQFIRQIKKSLLSRNLPNRIKLLSLVFLSLFFCVAGAVHSKTLDTRILSIAKVRQLPLGVSVVVEGTVTTRSGNFESSFFDKGFGLQDHSSGIYVSLQNDLDLVPGQRARVRGILQDNFGLLILAPTDSANVTIDDSGHKVRPQWFATGKIGETTEGRIVKVVGKITQAPQSDLPFGYKFFVNDGSGEVQIFVNVQTGINVSKLVLGQWISVVGFSSQFETHYEIDPRYPSDIEKPMR